MRQIIISHSDPVKLRTYKVPSDKSTELTMVSNSKQNQQTKKPKRFRSAFTTEQVNFLERQFKKFPYINKEHRIQIATILKMDERPIKIWFQNRRMKEKKETQKERHDETINPQAFVKNPFSNVSIVPSTNDHSSNSLSISTADATEKVNTVYQKQHIDKPSSKQENKSKLNMEIKSAQPEAKYYKENEDGEHLSPYINSPRANITKLPFTAHINNNTKRISAEFSINLCKQYKQDCATYRNTGYDSKKRKTDKVTEKLQEAKRHTPKHRTLPKQDATTYISPEEIAASRKPTVVYPSPLQAPRPVDLNNTYYPVMPTIYTPPFMSSGSVIWKPVNVMPVMAPNSPSMPLNVPGSTFHEHNKTCECNCHGSCQHIPFTFPPSFQNPYLQYVLTMPYQHTSPN